MSPALAGLDTTDVYSSLQQMGRIRMTQGVDRDAFFNLELFKDPA